MRLTRVETGIARPSALTVGALVAGVAAIALLALVFAFGTLRFDPVRFWQIANRVGPFAAAAGIAIGVPLVVLIQYHVSERISPELRAMFIIAIIGVGALLSVALTTRNLDERVLTERIYADYDDFAEGFAASRWLSVLVLVTSAAEFCRGVAQARGRRETDPAQPILHAIWAYYFGTVFIEAVASDHVSFSYKSVYVPTVLTAIYYVRVNDLRAVVAASKWVLFLLTLGSLGAIAVVPNFVVHRPDTGLLPGIDWRLFGLTSHPNTLGPVALLAIVLELHSPSRWRIACALRLISATAVLILAQSKTAWIAALAMLFLVHIPLGFLPSPEPGERHKDFNRSIRNLVLAIVVLVIACLTLRMLDVATYVKTNADIESLTGRTQIWDITLKAWRDNVFFGYGAEIWGAARRYEFRMFHVGQAHNQFIQTLGESGLVGLLLLLYLLGTLLRAAVADFSRSRGIGTTLLVLVIVRCFTEAPISGEGLLTWSTFLQTLIVLVTCHFLRNRVPAARPAQPKTRRTAQPVVGARPHGAA